VKYAIAMTASGRALDPITLECVCEGLQAIVREMRAAVKSTAYSSVIYDLDDFSCGLFDPQGQLVAQSEDHPGHVMPLPWSVQCAMEDFAGALHEGDMVILNDPYRGGTHLNDVTLIYPVFVDGALFIFPAVREHWTDVGGMTPGSYSGLATEIYQEGLRIPPIKICERGEFNRAAMALMFTNMRIPHEREGDFWAAVAALRTGERGIREIVAKYGRETFLQCVAQNLDRSERRIREKIAALPDGEYQYEDYLEFYHGGSLDPVLILVCLMREARTGLAIQKARRFAVNFLREDQLELSDRFAGRKGSVDRFEGLATRIAVTGAPVLEECLAWMDCRVIAITPAGDHTLYIGEVLASGVSGGKPLLYWAGDYRTLA